MESRVVLFSYDADMERVCAAAMRSCYSAHPSYDLYSYSTETTDKLEDERPFDQQRVKSLLRKAVELDHLDVVEHALLTFKPSPFSRGARRASWCKYRSSKSALHAVRPFVRKIQREKGGVETPSVLGRDVGLREDAVTLSTIFRPDTWRVS